ncbi:hypothetical protein LR48_Vigan08g048200 [Vigna angularis]|uniref:Uncharacterized protein n=1 Tax=Phaseolus angularis TaxID=3914 RepID=A0A0L9V3L2_PHAAN|nr:hypothetical protein LR48_Vigan08g048200 [Vigna angularis]
MGPKRPFRDAERQSSCNVSRLGVLPRALSATTLASSPEHPKGEGFLFPEWLTHQGLAEFVQMKGDCYPELVEVFYNNLKVINGDIHLWVKGVDIIVNDDVWLLVAGIKAESYMSLMKDSLHN